MGRYFDYCSGVISSGATVEWPADIRDEIIACALALCLAESNIRWRVSERISATDVPCHDGGAAYTLVSDDLALGLYRAAESKGFVTTLRQDIFEVPQVFSHPLLRDFFVCADWRLSRQHVFAESQHVNLQELGEIIL